MPTIEHIFAKDLAVGDVMVGDGFEVYTGSPHGPFVEHTRVCAVDHEFLTGRALGLVRDSTPPEETPQEMVYRLFPDAGDMDEASLAPVLDALANVQRWVPAAHPSHEIPQVRVILRRFGPSAEEHPLLDDDSMVGTEQILTLRWGQVVPVIRGDLNELTSK